jgi:pimeloyl-ACP methyl ester carboxylesterase
MLDRRTLIVSGALLAASSRLQAAGPAVAYSGEGPWTRRGTVARPGGVIGYAIAGRGPTLIALPKLGGWIDDWSPLARELAAEYTLVALDPPGHGTSRMATEPPQVQTLSESAAMIRATLEELDVGPFVLMGNSLGGCIAATMAALWPKSMTHLVLVSTAIYPKDPLAQVLADEARADPPVYEPDGDPLPRSPESAMRTFGMSAAFTAQMNRSRAAAGRWIRASERGVRREGLAELLPRIEAPTLLVYSDTGTYVRHRITAEKLLRNRRTATIPGAGSFVHQEKPAETARAIRDFLRA